MIERASDMPGPPTRLNPGALRWAQVLSWLGAASCHTAGVLGVLGLLLDMPALRSWFPDQPAMKFNTALGLAALGLALLALLPPTRTRARTLVGRAAGVVATAIGTLTAIQHVTGLDLHIDQLAFTEPPGEIATSSPGRMGLPAMVSFMVLGLGVLTVDRVTRRGAAPAQWCALGAGSIALLSLLGYVTGAAQLYLVAGYTGIALPTALGFFCLAVALFFARPEARPALVLLADDAGGQLARALLPATTLLPVGLVFMRLRGEAMGVFDAAFGRALSLLLLIVTFTGVVWRLSVRFSSVTLAQSLAELATRRARAEKERLASEHLKTLTVLDSLLAHAPVGLLFFDRARSVVRANDYLRQLDTQSGLSGADVAGSLLGAAPQLDEVLARALAGEAGELELTLGERTWLASLFPVRDGAAHVDMAGVVLLEITERKQLEAQQAALLASERAARNEAVREASLKDQFLATLSHELRTPLNAILGWASVAQSKVAPGSDVKRALDVVERNARLQTKLIEDLLDVSRIVSGKMHIDPQRVELDGVLEAALSAVGPSAEQKRVTLTAGPAQAVEVIGDAARLQQVFWNLLSNAVKFTPAGGRVELAQHVDEDAVRIVVSDSGAGIRADFLPHVFDRFRQADASTTRKHGGLGLGLAIVRQLVELHGGEVRAESDGEGRGARFTVTLARARKDDSLARRAEAESHAAPSLEGVNVLVVDDEQDAREFVARVLEDRGARTRVAASVSEALAAIATERPDVLVSDIGMAERDGLDLIADVRARFDASRLPAVALTALARSEDRARVLAAGFQVHLAKPVEPRELTLVVARLVASARAA